MNTHTELLSCWYICCPISHHTPKWWCITFLDYRLSNKVTIDSDQLILDLRLQITCIFGWAVEMRLEVGAVLAQELSLTSWWSFHPLSCYPCPSCYLSSLTPALKGTECYQWSIEVLLYSTAWTCLTYVSLSYLIGCLFFSMTAIKLTACSTHCLWDWDWEWRFSVPWTVPTAFFQ